ncbi:MAG TPA: U-box domain-containing protein [Gammaproteobacteria bacterium]|nr:U-box domain-containing protein [Gammaproteobacteria bacterium]
MESRFNSEVNLKNKMQNLLSKFSNEISVVISAKQDSIIIKTLKLNKNDKNYLEAEICRLMSIPAKGYMIISTHRSEIEFAYYHKDETKLLIHMLMETEPHKKNNNHQQASIPPAFICPLTGQIFKDPVVGNDGCSYERKAFEECMRENPKLHIVAQHHIALKNLIEQYHEDPAILQKSLSEIDDLNCGILGTVLFEPCITASGITYEKNTLQEWIEAKNVTDPATRGPILPKVMNLTIKHYIQSVLENNPNFIIELFKSDWNVTPENGETYKKWVKLLHINEFKKAELLDMVTKISSEETTVERERSSSRSFR